MGSAREYLGKTGWHKDKLAPALERSLESWIRVFQPGD